MKLKHVLFSLLLFVSNNWVHGEHYCTRNLPHESTHILFDSFEALRGYEWKGFVDLSGYTVFDPQKICLFKQEKRKIRTPRHGFLLCKKHFSLIAQELIRSAKNLYAKMNISLPFDSREKRLLAWGEEPNEWTVFLSVPVDLVSLQTFHDILNVPGYFRWGGVKIEVKRIKNPVHYFKHVREVLNSWALAAQEPECIEIRFIDNEVFITARGSGALACYLRCAYAPKMDEISHYPTGQSPAIQLNRLMGWIPQSHYEALQRLALSLSEVETRTPQDVFVFDKPEDFSYFTQSTANTPCSQNPWGIKR